ncbi:heat-inducible transcriptional repressor HrcA [Alkalibacter saccharofermentans]|uniref:Heat-inducible transcription repressor HrcA n=1 Tax=Alkalibacter saccharofermentans DSM 14828 TaxID=1120975 RepID=A0A1M4SN79_9FIRM|nr:heat-inducible transcriptional repressor HrcA [Alkalibacter saccharofermentans]SHE33629.1 heat-inducible transcription repressor HrcA [Alkalibacter saccharofermentans DSM 14828]
MDDKRERKLKILNSIIRDYIETAEPIGSRTIAKKYNLGISAATIRNEMSDLEEMGLLIQPHTSAGRIPSQKAYRLYVDELMKISNLNQGLKNEIRDGYSQYVEEIDKAIKHTAKVIAQLTSYTSIVSLPEMDTLNCKHVQLVPIEDERVLMVVVTKENIIKNYELKLSKTVVDGELNKLNNILNHIVKGSSFENIGKDLTQKINDLTLKENELLQEVVPMFKEVLLNRKENSVYSNGVTNILNYPEFFDIVKAKGFLDLIEKKNKIAELLTQVSKGSLNIIIGSENTVNEFKECSLITATYSLNGKNIGSIGVVGPVRMNYDYVVSVMNFLSSELNKQLNKEEIAKGDDFE